MFITSNLGQRVAQTHTFMAVCLFPKWMGIWACPIPWSHCGAPTNVVSSYIWMYKMHHTRQPYKQIWAHPLPNGHPLWQSKEKQPHLKFKIKFFK
jgi:hypothetical protein